MVKNIKIKLFLILSFCMVLVLMTVLGGSSLFYTQRLADQTIIFYDESHTVQVEVVEVQRVMSDIGSQLRRALIYKTQEMNDIVDQAIQADTAEMSQRIMRIKERFTGDEQLLLSADKVVEGWMAEIESLHTLVKAGNYEEATTEFANVYLPIEQQLNDAVDKISEYSQGVSLGFYEQAQRSKTISLWVIVGMVSITIILTVFICSSIIKSIMNPLQKVQAAAEAISRGDLRHTIDYEGNNEFGQLANSMKITVRTLESYINNINSTLDSMANNDMTVSVDMDYAGDFAPIKLSMQRILKALNGALNQISQNAAQVANSSEQVSASSQILSQGATEQAGSVEQLSSNLEDVASQVERNAEYTAQTNELVNRVGAELNHGNEQMRQMLEAMADINSSSDQIAKIIKTIEDIAFQTNILALNAAVEAARAGTAGKGFAVVADEVRNLAGKSAEAAKNTTALIQNSIKAVENGTQIADSTAQTLNSVVTRAMDITDMVGKIASSSEKQAQNLAQITSVVSQISQVIQTNSATAEESAAASEELSGQAQEMRALVSRFQLVKQQEPVYVASQSFLNG